MRFITNKLGDTRWDELSKETLAEFFAGDKATKKEVKEADEKIADFMEKAKHGDIFVFGLYRVVAIQLT